MHRRIVRAKNYNELCERTVASLLAVCTTAVRHHGRCTIALSGGSTPHGIYSMMAGDRYRHQFEWDRIHFFLGDERFVPPNDARSNWRMIKETLAGPANIPLHQFHPVTTEHVTPSASASLYESELRSFFAENAGSIPAFDCMLQGLGEDGHTASLFPGQPALHERDHLVVAAHVEGIPEPRISLTLPVIGNAKNVFFIVSGRSKAEVLARIIEDNEPLPAGMVDALHGESVWFVDADAASALRTDL